MNKSFGGVLIRNKRILLREPKNHFGGYVWTFAKGGRDPGESPEKAALREVKEETGYSARIVSKIDGQFRGETSITEMFLMYPISAQTTHDDETNQTRWVAYRDAVRMIRMTRSRIGRERDLAILESVKHLLT